MSSLAARVQNFATLLGSGSKATQRVNENATLARSMDPKQAAIITQFFMEAIPFNRFLGLQLIELKRGFATIMVPYRPELIGDPDRPALHGGVLSMAIDTAGGAAAFTEVVLPRDRISTIDLRVDYLRPGELQNLFCDATVSRMGNRVASVDVIAYHPTTAASNASNPRGEDSMTVVATGKAVYSIKRRGPRNADES